MPCEAEGAPLGDAVTLPTKAALGEIDVNEAKNGPSADLSKRQGPAFEALQKDNRVIVLPSQTATQAGLKPGEEYTVGKINMFRFGQAEEIPTRGTGSTTRYGARSAKGHKSTTERRDISPLDLMILYDVKVDVNNFLRFLPSEEAVWVTDALQFDGRPKGSSWRCPDLYIYNPLKKAGDFSAIASGAFICNDKALSSLRYFFEASSEILSIKHQGQSLYVINIIDVVNCLNDEKTVWVYGDQTKAKIRIKKHEFFSNRFSESTIFKIPETAKTQILTVENMKDEIDEFKARYRINQLSGLKFTELWRDE